jgi:16S rRNA (guanine966-N2)-methyltransferase
MTRIIAGTAGGRRLAVPPGQGTRPTSDRAREGLFGTVTAICGTLHGARVLDLYAGSGAVGLEALSRGAADVLLIEADRRAIGVIRDNVAAVGLPGARVLAGRVELVLARGPGGEPPRDVVFADPPYAMPDAGVPGQGRRNGRPGTRRTGPENMARQLSGTVAPQARCRPGRRPRAPAEAP